MITWIQRILMKNGRWIFSILLVIIIVAFVFTINQAGGIGSAPGPGGPQVFYGVDFNSAKEMRALQREVELSNWLTSGREPTQAAGIGELMQRVTLRHLAETLHLPPATDAQKAEYIKQAPLFRGANGRFSQEAYQAFLDRVESSGQLTLDLVAHVIGEDLRLQKAQALLGGPGYLQDFEVTRSVQDMETKRTALVATIPWADFLPEIEVTDEALRAHYDSRPDTWTLPPQAEVQLVRFRAANFVGQTAPPTEQELQSTFERNAWRFRTRPPATVDGQPAETPPEPVLEDHRDEVVRLVAEEKARVLALSAADRFATQLYRDKVTGFGEELDTLAASAGAQRIDLAPYARDSSPTNAPIPIGSAALNQVFELGAGRFFSDIFPIADGGGVLLLRAIKPARSRPLEEVRELVEADFRTEERRRLFDEHGRNLREQLLAAVTAGEDFRTVAEAAGLSVTEHAGYTAREPSESLDAPVGLALSRLGVGEITPMIIPAEGASGKLAYLASAEAPSPEEIATEAAFYRQQLMFFAQRIASQGLLEEVMRVGSTHLRTDS